MRLCEKVGIDDLSRFEVPDVIMPAELIKKTGFESKREDFFVETY